jgi:RNA polymerase sigma-70 factor (ECF subfamily)
MGAAAAPGEPTNLSLDACAQFYDQAFDEVYRYLSRAVLGNRVLAEDLTQETFTAIVASVRAGHASLQSMPWAIGIARHKLIDHYRRCESEQRRMALVWSGRGGSADQQLDDFDTTDPGRVAELLRELSPTHRLVLALRYVDDLTVEEIATAMGRSVHATESLLVRARRALTRSVQENVS